MTGMLPMIDEWYDRTYLACRAELNAGIADLFAKLPLAAAALARRLRRSQTPTAGDLPCVPDPSPSPSSRCP
jgi:hypothetical protein